MLGDLADGELGLELLVDQRAHLARKPERSRFEQGLQRREITIIERRRSSRLTARFGGWQTPC